MFLFRLALIAALMSLSPAHATPMAKEDVPSPLSAWISWALRGHEAELCPFYNGQPGRRGCAWPGPLKLSLDETSGRFEQTWTLHAADWVLLPGSAERWPQNVKIDGATAAVVPRGTAPGLRLKAGTHTISGTFAWDRLPQQLEVPAETGLLGLSVRGQNVAIPNRDEVGRLWLQAAPQATPKREQAHLEVTVHRRLTDDAPLQLTTRLQLKASGGDREVVLGPVLLDGFSPMSLTSPLPARVDPDGRVRVQTRAGIWDVVVAARRDKRGDELHIPKPPGAWAENEAWVYEARPDLRLADLTGAPTLDPAQTELPGDWRVFPAYLVKPGSAIKLVQRQRGDDPPAPDRLRLQRELWLDFNGRGLSARDTISGSLGRSWRLEAAPETALGRVAIDGVDQFLTQLTPGGPAGLEVRSDQVSIIADSRVEGRALTAAGWRQDFESVSARLHLPPGWRLIHAGGVDSAAPTWVSSWTLLDFFLVLIAASAFHRLWGRRWGLIALAGIGLAWHEPEAPHSLWLWALVFAALHGVLAEHPTAGRRLLIVRRGAWGLLAILCVPFLIKQARYALYPDLERPYERAGFMERYSLGELSSNIDGGIQPRRAPAASPEPEVLAEQESSDELEAGNAQNAYQAEASANAAASTGGGMGLARKFREERYVAKAGMRANASLSAQALMAPSSPKMARQYLKSRALNVSQMMLDPNAKITTGPGLPYWKWNTVSLTWKGPVPQGHRVSLWLIGPAGNFIIGWIRIALTVLLVLALFGAPVENWFSELRARVHWPLILLFFLLCAPGARAEQATFPPRELIDELRGKLLEAHECVPFCADSPRLRVQATATWLSLTLEVSAAAPTAIPIPTGGRDWVPARATLDSKPAGVRREGEGSLWVAMPAGSHALTLEGPLPDADAVSIALPLKPHRIDAQVAGWTLHGLRENGRPEDALQLSRARTGQAAVAAARAQGVFPPFLRVERIVHLGLSWTVDTRVTRLTPPGTPVSVAIPLLPGESVTSSDLRVVDGKVQFTLPPQGFAAGWSSALAQAGSIRLTAPETTQWSESWQVEPGQLWHVAPKGLVPVHAQPQGGRRSYIYRPWPGESVEFAVSRPSAIAGQTLTIDKTALTLFPGLRATDATLSLSVRSSRGGQHPLTLPDGAELLSAKIDGATSPLRLERGKLVVPIQPGAHAVEVSWRQPGGERAFYRAPLVDAGAGGVNDHVEINMPAGRWTLFLGGPGMGPAVVFWSLFAVLIIVSVGLGATTLAPLATRQWFLLSLGLTQVDVWQAALVVGWFLAVGLRGRHTPQQTREFRVSQVFLAIWTIFAATALFDAIKLGLLGVPDMQIAGNGSSASQLRWYLDRGNAVLPRPWVFSVPLGFYRAAMLCWALWLAQSLLDWSRWAWSSASKDAFWR